MNTIKLLALTTLALVACGDNKSLPDGHTTDGKTPDTPVVFPAAPTLGDQIDRMGRPAVNTVLNHGFDPTAAAATAKDAYNEMTSKTDWLTNGGEFAKNLAMVDVLDSGRCGNGICETGEANVAAGTDVACPGDCPTAAQIGAGNGCGNQVLYNGSPTGGGTPAATSYATLAGILAEDELYLDTTKATCAFYLAVEYGVVSTGSSGSNTTCGGRAPDYDVIDFSYSILAMGIAGINVATLTPLFGDGVDKHDDIATTFPYLGPPHS